MGPTVGQADKGRSPTARSNAFPSLASNLSSVPFGWFTPQRAVEFGVIGVEKYSTMSGLRRFAVDRSIGACCAIAVALLVAVGAGCGKTSAGDAGGGAPQAMPVQVRMPGGPENPDS